MSMRKMFSDIVMTTTTPETVNMFLTKLGHPVLNKATEFVVIEDFGCSSAADWSQALFTGGVDIFINIRINTTMYFTEPDGSPSFGIRGLLCPYPESSNITHRWTFDPEAYVLPGQIWEMVVYHGTMNYTQGSITQVMGMVVWTLYDGTDCVIANKLLEMGIKVTPANIDWYKRILIEKKQTNQQQ